MSCHNLCSHFTPIQPYWVLTLLSLQNPPGRPLFPPPALRAQTSSDCEPWEHSRSSSVGDIHWQLAKNGQEQARLATPDGSFSLPYDATIPCRAKVVMPGGFSGSCGVIPRSIRSCQRGFCCCWSWKSKEGATCWWWATKRDGEGGSRLHRPIDKATI